MRALGSAVAGVLLLPVLVIGAALGVLDAGLGSRGSVPGSMPARATIPAERLSLYEEAGAAFSVPVAILAAVGKVECDHGRDPGCLAPNHVGAAGPMQFLPATWARYQHASGSATPSVYDPRDAVHAAANKLAADGLTTDPWAALRAYNPSDTYAATVLAWALAYGWSPPDASILARAVLSHPHLPLAGTSRGDVVRGAIDGRVLAVLLIVATEHRLGAIGPFTAHHYYVRGTTKPSNHVFGRAIDVGAVDTRAVSASNAAARAVVIALIALPPPLRPDELGSPFSEFAHLPGPFTDSDHLGHLHIGYDA